jgi:tetratricopeptide (TPR) repeat protein
VRIGIWITFVAALAGALPAGAQTQAVDPTLEQAFERELAAHDLTAAAASLDRLIAARMPSGDKPVPDPYLNHRIGRFLLISGQPRAALSWLEAAGPAADTAKARAQLALDLARALLLIGQAEAALPLIDVALRDLPDATAQGATHRLRIDALLATDPAAAVTALSGAAAIRASDAGAEWDWALLDARAALLTGSPAAGTKVRHAWMSATTAPVAASAPARAAALMAMVEERASRRSGALAMIAAATRTEPDVSAMSKQLSAALPPCGTAVTPADHVTVALHRDSLSGATRISAIAASRPGVVPHFLSGVNAAEVLPSGELNTAATIARLRCRSGPALEAIASTADRELAAVFMAQRGLFPRFGFSGTGEERLNAASQEVDAMTARYGADSPLLLGPLMRLNTLSQARLMEAGDIPPTRLVDLSNRLDRVLLAAGDTAAFLPRDAHYFAAFARAVNASSREESARIMADSFRTYIAKVDPSIAYAILTKTADSVEPAQLDAMRADLIARASKTLPAGDPRIAAMRLARVSAARTAEDGTLAARIRETGLPRDLCAVQPVAPRLRSIEISDDDYPAEGLIAEITGRTTLEFDLDASGRVRTPRAIIAVPPILFDDVVARDIDGISYVPAEAAGRATPCRAMTMSIRWKMPDRSEGVPDVIPQNWIPGN